MDQTVKFNLGEIVYHKTSDEQCGIITGIIFRPFGVQYGVTWNDTQERWHFDLELTTEKVLTIKSS